LHDPHLVVRVVTGGRGERGLEAGGAVDAEQAALAGARNPGARACPPAVPAMSRRHSSSRASKAPTKKEMLAPHAQVNAKHSLELNTTKTMFIRTSYPGDKTGLGVNYSKSDHMQLWVIP
jgi:hypothetical protein